MGLFWTAEEQAVARHMLDHALADRALAHERLRPLFAYIEANSGVDMNLFRSTMNNRIGLGDRDMMHRLLDAVIVGTNRRGHYVAVAVRTGFVFLALGSFAVMVCAAVLTLWRAC